MRRICIYAGSNIGQRPQYQQAARDLGTEMVARGLSVVYGGGRVGLMGTLADTVMAAGGEVIGVMPTALFPVEIADRHVTTLHEVGSMHERKALMADLADGFIALPGGFGTYDELFEIITWSQLRIHQKPIGLLNVADYFSPLLALIEHSVNEGFIAPFHSQLLLRRNDPRTLLDDLAAYVPPPPKAKWTDPPAR